MIMIAEIDAIINSGLSPDSDKFIPEDVPGLGVLLFCDGNSPTEMYVEALVSHWKGPTNS